MTTIGSRTWRPGPGRVRSDLQTTATLAKAGGAATKLLARAEASLAESERRLTRQTVLLAELRAAGSATGEAEKSLARLETAVHEERSNHKQLHCKVSEETHGGAPRS